MKKIVMLSLFVFFTFFAIMIIPDIYADTPVAKLYEHSNYGGSEISTVVNIDNLNTFNFNDKTSSIKIEPVHTDIQCEAITPQGTFNACLYDSNGGGNIYIAGFKNAVGAGVSAATTPVADKHQSIGVNWKSGSPSNSVGTDGFAIMYKGQFRFKEGAYKFTIESDDDISINFKSLDTGSTITKYYKKGNRVSTKDTFTSTFDNNDDWIISIRHGDISGSSILIFSWERLADTTPPSSITAKHSPDKPIKNQEIFIEATATDNGSPINKIEIIADDKIFTTCNYSGSNLGNTKTCKAGRTGLFGPGEHIYWAKATSTGGTSQSEFSNKFTVYNSQSELDGTTDTQSTTAAPEPFEQEGKIVVDYTSINEFIWKYAYARPQGSKPSFPDGYTRVMMTGQDLSASWGNEGKNWFNKQAQGDLSVLTTGTWEVFPAGCIDEGSASNKGANSDKLHTYLPEIGGSTWSCGFNKPLVYTAS